MHHASYCSQITEQLVIAHTLNLDLLQRFNQVQIYISRESSVFFFLVVTGTPHRPSPCSNLFPVSGLPGPGSPLGEASLACKQGLSSIELPSQMEQPCPRLFHQCSIIMDIVQIYLIADVYLLTCMCVNCILICMCIVMLIHQMS